MVKYLPTESNIHFIARGLLVQGDNVILCRVKNKDWYFLPGGHIESGESSKAALFREIKEESSIVVNEALFIGVCETIFLYDEEFSQHEVDFVFQVAIPEGVAIASKEDHLEYVVIKKEDFMDCKIFPEKMKDGICEWIETGISFLKEL